MYIVFYSKFLAVFDSVSGTQRSHCDISYWSRVPNGAFYDLLFPHLRQDQFLRATPVSGGVGEFLMRKMGWKTGEGLGRNRKGTVEPIIIDFKVDRKGTKPHSQRPSVHLILFQQTKCMKRTSVSLKSLSFQYCQLWCRKSENADFIFYFLLRCHTWMICHQSTKHISLSGH